MNFLAHAYLSGNNEKILIGNFIGDFVKGRQYESFEEEIKQGILLHRQIDEFTDKHPIVLQSKKRLWDNYRHYSGVIIDLYYDHFLANQWSLYHHQPLIDYTEWVYNVLKQHFEVLPHGAQYVLPHMQKENWLKRYENIEGIGMSLTGLSKRAKFNSKMEQATKDLKLHYSEFEHEFKTFFPDIEEFIQNKIKED